MTLTFTNCSNAWRYILLSVYCHIYRRWQNMPRWTRPTSTSCTFFGETVREGVYRSILFLTKKLHLILFWQNILFYPVFIWGCIVTCHAQNVFPDTWSNVFHLKSSRLFDQNNPFYGNAALFEKSKNTSRKTVIIERLLSLSRRLTTVQCLKAHVNFLIIEFFSKWN